MWTFQYRKQLWIFTMHWLDLIFLPSHLNRLTWKSLQTFLQSVCLRDWARWGFHVLWFLLSVLIFYVLQKKQKKNSRLGIFGYGLQSRCWAVQTQTQLDWIYWDICGLSPLTPLNLTPSPCSSSSNSHAFEKRPTCNSLVRKYTF